MLSAYLRRGTALANFCGDSIVNVLFRGKTYPCMVTEGDTAASILKQIGVTSQGMGVSMPGTDAPGYPPVAEKADPIPAKVPYYTDLNDRFRIRHIRILPNGPGPGFQRTDPPVLEIVEI